MSDKKNTLASLLPLLLLPLLVGGLTGLALTKADIFTKVEKDFKTLLTSGEINYSDTELAKIETNSTTLEVPKVLNLYVENETNDTVVLKSNVTDLEFIYDKNQSKLYLPATMTWKFWRTGTDPYTFYVNITAPNYVCYTVKIDTWSTDYQWEACGNFYRKTGSISSGGNLGYQACLYIDGVKKACLWSDPKTTSSYSGTIDKNVPIEGFIKGIREENISLTIEAPEEIIIVSAEPSIISGTNHYKLVAGWDENIQYSVNEIKYEKDFINALYRYFKPARSYAFKIGENEYKFVRAKDGNVMAIFENTTFTTYAKDKVLSVIVAKSPEYIKIDGNTVKVKADTFDTWIKLEPVNTTVQGKLYIYSMTVWDRIVGFFKSLLRFDIGSAISYATGTAEVNGTITAVSPNYINLITTKSGEITVSDASTPTDIDYAGERFSTIFALKYNSPRCIDIQNKLICGQTFIIATQNNIVFIMSAS